MGGSSICDFGFSIENLVLAEMFPALGMEFLRDMVGDESDATHAGDLADLGDSDSG
jgi:hypothetical protein